MNQFPSRRIPVQPPVLAPLLLESPLPKNPPAASLQKDVAIGVAKGLKAESIRTFVVTLREHSAADIFLFVDAIPANMPAYQGLHFLVFDQNRLPRPWSRYHPSSYRYHLYHEFMQTTGKAYARVQACDIRDVAFQADPFLTVSAGEEAVHIFEEDASMTIGKCGTNSRWIQACYGGAAQRVAAQPISCSGYAIGTAKAMAQYFEVMAGEIRENARCEQNGIDQGMHNVLVNSALAGWTATNKRAYSPLPTFVSHSNERGPVYTGGYAPKGNYSWGADGAFLNHDGISYRVLHQYYRHAKLTSALEEVVVRLSAGRMHAPARTSMQSLLHTAAPETTSKQLAENSNASVPAAAETTEEGSSGGGGGNRRRALFFLVHLDPTQASWFAKRHSGELEFVNSLASALRAAGWEVEESGEIDEVQAYMAAAAARPEVLANTHFFFDVGTATNFYDKSYWSAIRCRVRVLDFFGSPATGALGLGAKAMARGIQPKQFWTPYPNRWNEFLGFPLEARPPTPKKHQGVLWGKMLEYLQGHEELIRELGKLSPLYAVVQEPHPPAWLREAGVTVRPLMQPSEWEELVAESKYFIGFGDPLLGPSVMHCLAAGTPYLDPVFSNPKAVASGMTFTSQHPYAHSFGAPLVHRVHLDNIVEVVATVKRVLSAPPVAPFVPSAMTPGGYKAKVEQLMMEDNFCTTNMPENPADSDNTRVARPRGFNLRNYAAKRSDTA
eukprot:CAMPEP_0118928546 /NCGR_PEP_ID=MMETSP1169-20130426/5777_1 /TAXON_ID=36882 /ORGANISM="Pyramimonas obovata, Strain CCMP722" /LENGTH=724 /DNA_ID=CAMNT_0006870553 /DNA_START=461 /DNA_END=2638 /DNA_ORIENTATION=+